MAMLRPVLVTIVLAPAAYNISVLAAQRGADVIWEAAATGLAARFDPARTVFLYQGFEGIITWQSVMLGGEYVEADTLPAASAARRTFKYLDATSPTIQHPDWTQDQIATAMRRRIDAALDRGYQVVAGPAYVGAEADWVNSFVTIARPGVPEAIRAMLAENYHLTPAFTSANGETYSLLLRRAAPP